MTEVIFFASLIAGLAFLAIAGDYLVSGAVALARRMGVSPLVAGILIVGFGTSAPEMVVSVDAAWQGDPGIAIGNIVGSNIANVWLVLGVPALMVPLAATSYGQRRAMFVMLAATAAWITVTAMGGLGPHAGMAFLAALGLYIVATIVMTSMASRRGVDIGLSDAPLPSRKKMWIALAIGIIGLPIGARLIVYGGVGIARVYEIPEEVIGLTLLAIGTSLPEIGASLAAIFRKETDVIIGNVIGSNIFNLLGAGGLVALFGQVELADTFIEYDHWAMGAAAITVALFVLPRKRISRLAALAMILVYATYIYGLVSDWNILAEVRYLSGQTD